MVTVAPWPQVKGMRRKIERRRTGIERMPNTGKDMFKDLGQIKPPYKLLAQWKPFNNCGTVEMDHIHNTLAGIA